MQLVIIMADRVESLAPPSSFHDTSRYTISTILFILDILLRELIIFYCVLYVLVMVIRAEFMTIAIQLEMGRMRFPPLN